jgi:hypothetical protein
LIFKERVEKQKLHAIRHTTSMVHQWNDYDKYYPEILSSELILVKWWVLALPHYIIVRIFNGGFGLLTDVYPPFSLWD